jgi:hypothetical protein
MALFSRCWTALRTAVAELPEEDFERPSDCVGRPAGTPFPARFSDKDALLIGTGRRAPTDTEKAALSGLATRLPLILG